METPTVVKPDRIEWQPVGQLKVEGHRLYIDDCWMIGSKWSPDHSGRLRHRHGLSDVAKTATIVAK